MPDGATSSDPAVQEQLDRLMALGPGADVLGLDRITRLLDRLGNPERSLPPVFHVAGTNGKGSTCAFLRSALEAAGHRVHVYSSPHLVRFNERIRLAGALVDDSKLVLILKEVLDVAQDVGASFFEVTTAAALLLFERTPADACIVEVGLGGRLDATNVIPRPAMTAIAQLGIDHQAFLGDTAEAIAAEKAGIAKPGVPMVTMGYPAGVATTVAQVAAHIGAPLHMRGVDWDFSLSDSAIEYRDCAGRLTLPLPALAGSHQPANLALAAAMLRHQTALVVSPEAMAEAARSARWPARMQRLGHGPLTARLAPETEVWLDGGHNEAAAIAVSQSLAAVARGRPVAIILGMLSNKDAAGLLAPFAAIASQLRTVPVPGHAHHAPDVLADLGRTIGIPDCAPCPDIAAALDRLAAGPAAPPVILILGSLYLAGTVLQANGESPS